MRSASLALAFAAACAFAAAQDRPPEARPEVVAPFLKTPEKVVGEMLKLAGVKAGEVVCDLGCGDGRIAVAAVRDFKAKRGLGIDFDPERIRDSKAAARRAGPAVEKKLLFQRADVLALTEKDLDGIDVVALYLLPELNARLKPVLRKGLKPGARVVSRDFDMGDDWKPDKTVELDHEGVGETLYLWVIGEKK